MSTKTAVTETAQAMVKENGLINLSRRELCERAGIPDGSFPHVMGCNFAEFVQSLDTPSAFESGHKVSKSRANPELRRDHILATAVGMAQSLGLANITRDAIAEKAGVSNGLVTRYFKTMTQLRGDIMRRAIKQEILEIVAYGLAIRDSRALHAPLELRERAAKLTAGV